MINLIVGAMFYGLALEAIEAKVSLGILYVFCAAINVAFAMVRDA